MSLPTLILLLALARTIESCDKCMRTAAWIGDSTHKTDIRTVLILRDIDCKLLEPEEQVYTSNKAQASYWCSIDTKDLVWQPKGSSIHNLGTAFEANYDSIFRQRYLISMFPEEADTVLRLIPNVNTTIRNCHNLSCSNYKSQQRQIE